MKRYNIEIFEHEDSHGDFVRYSEVRRIAREVTKIADEMPAESWVELQDKLHMLAKSILGEH